MDNAVLTRVLEFKKRYKGTIGWRLKKHAKLVEYFLNPEEKVLYAFPAQNNDDWYNIFSTCIVAITNKRFIIGTKRFFFGHFLTSITPDLFNDLKVNSRLIWGTAEIDTVKENIFLSNISKKALNEIETEITEYVLREKKKYLLRDKKNQST